MTNLRNIFSLTFNGTSTIYTIILLKSVGVNKLQVAILVRSSREMSQTVRIDWKHILSRVRVSFRPRVFFICEKQASIRRAVSRRYIGAAFDAWSSRKCSSKGPVQWHSRSSRQARWWTLLTENKWGAQKCVQLCLCTTHARELKVPRNTILQNCPQGITGHWVEGSFEIDKCNLGRRITLFVCFHDLTNYGCISSSSETSLFTPAAVVGGWSAALPQDHCRQLSVEWENGCAAMVWAYRLVSFVLSNEENDSRSPIIGDGFLLHAVLIT